MLEPSAGWSWVTRTPGGMAVSETSLTAFVEVDIGKNLSELRHPQSNRTVILGRFPNSGQAYAFHSEFARVSSEGITPCPHRMGRAWSPGVRAVRPAYGLTLANLTTLLHFSVSSAIIFANWPGDPGNSVPPSSTSFDFIFGSARNALISLLSKSTIGAGVAFGTPMPYHCDAS